MQSWHLYVPLNARGSSGAQERDSSRRFIPFLIRKCAHLVIFAHKSLQVKHLTQVCEGEKQSQLLPITLPLWFWRRIRLVVHFRYKFLSFLCCETSCFKMTFHHNVKKNLFHISTNHPAFLPVYWLTRGPETDIVPFSSGVSDLIYRVFRRYILTIFCYCTAG